MPAGQREVVAQRTFRAGGAVVGGPVEAVRRPCGTVQAGIVPGVGAGGGGLGPVGEDGELLCGGRGGGGGAGEQPREDGDEGGEGKAGGTKHNPDPHSTGPMLNGTVRVSFV